MARYTWKIWVNVQRKSWEWRSRVNVFHVVRLNFPWNSLRDWKELSNYVERGKYKYRLSWNSYFYEKRWMENIGLVHVVPCKWISLHEGERSRKRRKPGEHVCTAIPCWLWDSFLNTCGGQSHGLLHCFKGSFTDLAIHRGAIVGSVSLSLFYQ